MPRQARTGKHAPRISLVMQDERITPGRGFGQSGQIAFHDEVHNKAVLAHYRSGVGARRADRRESGDARHAGGLLHPGDLAEVRGKRRRREAMERNQK
jgi:hypothetical protein